MKAYKVEILVVDFDGIGQAGIIGALENTRYPNHCISPSVQAIHERDIGPWSDGHPLNVSATAEAEYKRLFSEQK
jgi:hypothetical protein